MAALSTHFACFEFRIKIVEIGNIKNKKLQFNLKLQEILDNIFPILLKGCHSHPALPCNAQIANSNHRDAQE